MVTLHELAQRRGTGELQDTKFMSAAEKRKVLKQWETFLKYGCKREHFTKPLYHHLIQHCSFIAHYDLNGFYDTYFTSGDDTRQFLSQFDDRTGMPVSVEYGMTYWITDQDYCDINSEMVRIAGKYIPGLLKEAKQSQEAADIAEARRLLSKHGIKLS